MHFLTADGSCVTMLFSKSAGEKKGSFAEPYACRLMNLWVECGDG
jgi:hypothetical protein